MRSYNICLSLSGVLFRIIPSKSIHVVADGKVLFFFFFLMFILLIILLQLSHFFLPFIPLWPGCPLHPAFPHLSSCPWVLHINSLASPFPILFLTCPYLFFIYQLCFLTPVPFLPFSSFSLAADNPPNDLHSYDLFLFSLLPSWFF